MTRVAFPTACMIHKNSATVTLTRCPLKHIVLEQFSRNLYRFIQENAEDLRDAYWTPIISFFKRQWYLMMSTPLPFKYLGALESKNADVAECIALTPDVFPDLADDAMHILALYRELVSEDGNPLMDAIKKNLLSCDANERPAILMSSGRWIPQVNQLLSEACGAAELHVISPDSLSGGVCYDVILGVGPARWFPNHVFVGGRTSKIYLYYYAWLWDRSPKHEAFSIATVKIKRKKREIRYLRDNGGMAPSQYAESELIDPNAVVPEVDVEKVRDKMRQAADPMERDRLYEVDAKLFILEGDAMVMLEMSENAKAYVIDPLALEGESDDESEEESEDEQDDEQSDEAQNADASVIRINTSEIQPGMFLLIRTHGGGDYIAPIADHILGKDASKCRAVQTEWKSRLKNKVREFGGVDETVGRLRELGSVKASPTNLRNWTAERTICTRDQTDFYAIMRLIGLEDKKEKFWKISQKIHSAHRKAGFLIRKILLNKIRHADFTELEKKGRMDFSFGDTDNSNMAVIRVKRILDEQFSCPESSLGKLLEGSEELWR